jgi:hypothetical protein
MSEVKKDHAEANSPEGGGGDARKSEVGVARKGWKDSQGLQGPQRGLQAQAGRGREVDGQEAHRSGLETTREGRSPSLDSGPADAGECSLSLGDVGRLRSFPALLDLVGDLLTLLQVPWV